MNLNCMKATVSGILFAATLVLFQNCAPAKFTQASDLASLKAEAQDGTSESEAGGVDPAVGDDPVKSEDPPKKDDQAENENPSKCDKKDHMSAVGMVECEMVSPNAKVILGQSSKNLELGSNASATRICMSENACLKLINSYAAARSCSLSLGASASTSQTQCAKIFPGSKGTCKNAKLMSDEEVSAVLLKMGL